MKIANEKVYTLSVKERAKKLEDNLLAFITGKEIDHDTPETVTVMSIALSTMLVKVNKMNGMPRKNFMELVEATWDRIERDVH